MKSHLKCVFADIAECEDGTYGKGCTSICGNCHGDEMCNKQNGTCQACECGYTGHDCKGDMSGQTNKCNNRSIPRCKTYVLSIT